MALVAERGVLAEQRIGAATLGDQIEATLGALLAEVTPAAGARRRGRPPILPAMLLWSGVVVSVLRGASSLREIWRLISATGLWRFPAVAVSDDAVTKRLLTAGPAGLERLFADLSALLRRAVTARTAQDLAPFAPEIFVLDETTLDPVARKLPALRGLPDGDHRRLPGKLAGLYDLRRQLWHRIVPIADPDQNERVAAPDLVADLPAGSLLLFDLGYFGFAWLDGLTDAGFAWITRMRSTGSYEVAHTCYHHGETRDALVWLGAYRKDKAKHLVRLVEFRVGDHRYTYLTNVTDPDRLPLAHIPRLYARRWDIERAVDLVKTHLGLHLIWSGKPGLVLIQVWAVLIIAQMIQALRGLVAEAADADLEEVSLRLLVQYFPRYAERHADPVAAYARDGRRLGFIRPSRRRPLDVPEAPRSAYQPPPDALPRTRPPRYGSQQRHRRSRARATPTPN